ncbi:MAG TPA: cysteine--tRNA ligase [Candidatus Nanoarchaeia archaeon]|nr:cysteine--tRNA ligase [Candidatus Nanoarchaeia archaeon]
MPPVLYNTLNRRKEPFVPLKNSFAGLYTCGPTVYNFAHIGNFRSYIFEDILKRALLFNGFKVDHVMNITDVGHLTSDADEGEDKMTKGLRREGLPITLAGMKTLADKYLKAFVADLKQLHILLPDQMPKASEHIPEDIKFITILKKKGFTYQTSDGIYFDTAKLKDYGKLAAVENNQEHQRIKTGEKKNHRDFALWKFNENLGWSSPFSDSLGFPGWHIECSVMASKYLGKQFDIHCGGQDLAKIHHNNEIAQSEAAFNKKPWVKYWMHNEFVVLDKGEKMSKSKKNIIVLATLTQNGYHPLDYRYLCLGTHYRNPLMFSWEALEGAKQARKKLLELILKIKASKDKEHKPRQKKYLAQFVKEVNDDLNTPKAMAVVWEVVKAKELTDKDKYLLLLQFDKILGFNLGSIRTDKIPTLIVRLAKEREKARAEKDWVKSDQLRDEIKSKGYLVEDGAKWFRLKKS